MDWRIIREDNFGSLLWNIVMLLSVFWQACAEIFSILPDLPLASVHYACCSDWSQTRPDSWLLTDLTETRPLMNLAFHSNIAICRCSIRIRLLFCQCLIRKINCTTKAMSWGLYLEINLIWKANDYATLSEIFCGASINEALPGNWYSFYGIQNKESHFMAWQKP